MAEHESAPLSYAGRLTILGGGMLPTIAISTMAVMLPSIADAFGNGSNGVEIKMVSTALGLGMLFGAPIGGMLADGIGRRATLILAMALFGMVGSGMMAAEDLWQIILGRFVVGLATGAIGVTIAAFIGDHFDGILRSRWIGFNASIATFSALVANPLTDALADKGWHYGFAIYVLAFPILVVTAIGVPGRRASAEHEGHASSARLTGSLPIRGIVLAVILGTLTTGTSLYWPFRLREVGVISARDIAFISLPNAFAIGAAALAYGLVRRKLSISQVFLIGALGSSLALVLVGFASQAWSVALGLTFEGIAVGLLTPNLTTYVLRETAPGLRGRNIGLVKGALYGSPFLTQFFLEPLNGLGGASYPLWGVSLLAAALGMAVLAGALGHRARQPMELGR